MDMVNRLRSYRNGVHGQFFLDVADRLEELRSENENLQIEHDVMFARIRDANGQYTPDEVSRLLDAEIKTRREWLEDDAVD